MNTASQTLTCYVENLWSIPETLVDEPQTSIHTNTESYIEHLYNMQVCIK